MKILLGFDGAVPALALALSTGCAAPPAEPPSGQTVFEESFQAPDGLLASEENRKAYERWEVTSGALFARGGSGWTGKTGDGRSAVFRCVTRERVFGDVEVTFKLLNNGLASTARTPPKDWDGVHLFLRYQSQYQLYAATLNRRDDAVVIKKKIPGGSDNGGTYFNLTPALPHPVPYGRWQEIRAAARTLKDGSVELSIYADGELLAQAVDDGSQGGAPIRKPGRVGLRGDNADFMFKDFKVKTLEAAR